MNRRYRSRWLRILRDLICGPPPQPPPPPGPSLRGRVEVAIEAASKHLMAASEDGRWSGQGDPELDDPFVLKGLALRALRSFPQPAQVGDAIATGLDSLQALVKDGKVDFGDIPTPLHNAAVANSLYALALSKRHREAPCVSVLTQYLCDAQYAQPAGYLESDVEFGGFGYRAAVPKGSGQERKPELDYPHLGATLLVVEALSSVPSEPARAAVARASRFVERCQNFGGGGDGGFIFSPAIAELNKAGRDPAAPTGFRSYGSMTANGLRLLNLADCGQREARKQAATQWLAARFRADQVPGEFPVEGSAARDSIYYYYVWTVAHALDGLAERTLEREGREIRWAAELAEELLRKQLDDGVFVNPGAARKENIVPVGTLLSLPALSICLKYLD